MEAQQPLHDRRCVPCEGGIPPLDPEATQRMLGAVADWKLADDGRSIYLERKFKNFVEGLDYLNRVGELAEQEQHHPDLHLTGYRHVRIELSTHAIQGLSENDFILAAKIDHLQSS